jgi:hypothetical protein
MTKTLPLAVFAQATGDPWILGMIVYGVRVVYGLRGLLTLSAVLALCPS